MATRGGAKGWSVSKPANQGSCANMGYTEQKPLCCGKSRDTRPANSTNKNTSIIKPGSGTGPDGTTVRKPGF